MSMTNSVTETAYRTLTLPVGMPTERYLPRPTVNVPVDRQVPLFDRNDPKEKKIQEQLIAKVRVFNLSDEDQRKACEAVWQSVCEGKAVMSEAVTEFNDGAFICMLRWSEFVYRLPQE